MHCLRRNPKHTAAYEAYLDEHISKNSASDRGSTLTPSPTARFGQPPAVATLSTNELHGFKPERQCTAPTAMTQTPKRTSKRSRRLSTTNFTRRTANTQLRRQQRQQRRARQHQLPDSTHTPSLPLLRPPSWHFDSYAASQSKEQARTGAVPSKQTPEQRAGAKRMRELEDSHRRMGISGWCGPKQQGALHSMRMHEYVSRGRNSIMNKTERAEDRAMLKAVGIVIQGL